MSPEIVWFALGLIGAGLFAGFVVVPALYFVFTALGVDESVRIHLAVGTSLSTIISTSWRSLAAHTKAGAVDYSVLKAWGPWITLGALAGAIVAGIASNEALLLVFGFGLLLVALQMGLGNPNFRLRHELPTGAPRAVIASSIGLLSALMGIGGGAFGVTVMTLCGRPIHQAVATASGFGAAIALPASLGYIIAGWGREGLPPWSLGFVSLPGFFILAALTAITAPIGARLAHRLPQQTLKRAFAIFLAVIALNMLREAFS
jgi:uncharacterized membrane protein YfcA